MSVRQLILGREYAERPQMQFHFPPHYTKWLALSEELHGHMGCVNRIAWNEDGTKLASGSDDRKVILWNYPDRSCPPLRIDTMHDLNIFGVAFLPCTNSTHIVTSAFDRMVQLHRLDHTSMVPTAGQPRSDGEGAPPVAAQAVRCHTTTFLNHSESVKDVAVEPVNPHCFWSAAQDGRVHQFDLRCPDVGEATAASMLIQAPASDGYAGLRVEFKSLDVNNARPWMMATACSDRFVRVYDRRKLSLRLPSAARPSQPLLELCPLHLNLPGHKASAVYTTCARFSHHGDRLVATYHREQAYTFDVTRESAPARMSFCSTRPCLRALEAAARQNDAGYDAHQQDPPLDTESAEMRRAANEAVMEDRWDDALALYGRLLERVPWLAQTWAARAIVLLRRGWKGDALCALRDADTCAALSPHWPKAYETRIRCLRSLGQIHTAMAELSLLTEEFPDEAGSSMLWTLRIKLEKELEAIAQRNAHTRLQQQEVHTQPNGAVPHHDNAAAAPPHLDGADHIPEPADGPPTGQAQGQGQRGPGLPGQGASELSGLATVPEGSPCRHFRAYVRSLHPPEDGEAGKSWEPGDSVLHRIHNGCQLPGQNGFRSTLDDPATSSNGNVADEHCAAGGPDPTAAAPAQPDRVTRWVRQALQQSWGAWLAGGESTAAWDVCRQGATDADAAFMEDVRRMAWQADSQPAQHTQEGVPMEGSLGNLGNLGVLPADMNSSGAIMSPVHRRRWSDGNDLGSLREFEGWDSIHADGADASPWLAGEAMDGLQQAVGAVVDDGDRLVGGLAATEHQGCLRSGAAEMPLPERRFQGHGPELCSYIYGHRRWNEDVSEYVAPQGCSRATTGRALEALAAASMRTEQRFVGQCNVITDIKEATFVGQEGAVVACGSDQGRVFLFDSLTGDLLRVLWADREVANCVQCHPTLPVLATSGMEDVVKLWEVERDNDANRVGAGDAEVSRMVEESQQEMEASRVFLPNIRESQLRDFVRHPEMLQLMGLTQVGIREDEGGSSEVTCRQS